MLVIRSNTSGFSMHRFFVAAFFVVLLTIIGPGILPAQTTSLTVNSESRLSISGVSALDRAKFFTHTSTLAPPANRNSNPEMKNLRFEVYSANGLNLTPGRISSEFDQGIAQGLPEDPSRPGLISQTAMQNELQGSYRNFVTTSSRYESLRDSATPGMIVGSGRSATDPNSPVFFDQRFRTGEQSNAFPNRNFYADFLRNYLREVIFGPNAFYPVSTDRFHIELLNEPDLHLAGAFGGPSAASALLSSSQELALYHRDVAQMVKAEFASASIGGPGLAITDFTSDNYLRWNSTVEPFIDIAGADLDFYTIHPYKRYDVQSSGNVRLAVEQSPGRINSQIDMMLNRQEQTHGNRLPLSITEYSSFNLGINGSTANGSYGNYERDMQQWDQSRNLREQLLLYIKRPDAILSAVPFVFANHFRNDVPSRESDDNLLYERDAGGNFIETIIGNTMRIYAPVSGEYIDVHGANDDLQAVAFRDGNRVHLLLNNLLDSNHAVDLNLLLSDFGTVVSAAASRVFRLNAAGNLFIENQDVTNNFENLVLNPKEGAVITFVIGNDTGFSQTLFQETFFGDQVAAPLNDGLLGRSPEVTINAQVSGAIGARLRVGYSRSVGVDAFSVSINGNTISLPGVIRGVDDEELGSIDEGLISREFDVPLNYLTDGDNLLRFNFTGGGFLSSTALVITTSVPEPGAAPFILGDCSQDGVVDFFDIAPFIEFLSSGAYLAQADCNQDGEITFADIASFVIILSM